jgi:hypothetical protein
MIAEHLGCLRPQRAKAFFSAFTEEPDLKRAYQLQIARPQVDDLLYARPRVEHSREERVVAAAIPTCSVDSKKDSFDFIAFQVFDHPLASALKGHTQDALNPVELFGMVGSHVTEEGVDRGQTDIASCHSVLAYFLQIGKESDYVVRFDVIEVQVLNPSLSFRR